MAKTAYRHNSEFGPAKRVRLDRNQRAAWRWIAKQHRKHNRLSPAAHDVAEAQLQILGDDGQLDPSHATIAAKAGCHVATVARGLEQLRRLGLIQWVRRLRRDSTTGWRVEQTSNAYVLVITRPENRPNSCDTQDARQRTLRISSEREKTIAQMDAEAFASRDRQLAALLADIAAQQSLS